MKIFEEYWDYTGLSDHINLVREDGGYEKVPNYNLKKERAEGWQAALRWVLRNCPLTHIGREKIQEELGENESSDAVSGLPG